MVSHTPLRLPRDDRDHGLVLFRLPGRILERSSVVDGDSLTANQTAQPFLYRWINLNTKNRAGEGAFDGLHGYYSMTQHPGLRHPKLLQIPSILASATLQKNRSYRSDKWQELEHTGILRKKPPYTCLWSLQKGAHIESVNGKSWNFTGSSHSAAIAKGRTSKAGTTSVGPSSFENPKFPWSSQSATAEKGEGCKWEELERPGILQKISAFFAIHSCAKYGLLKQIGIR